MNKVNCPTTGDVLHFSILSGNIADSIVLHDEHQTSTTEASDDHIMSEVVAAPCSGKHQAFLL